MAAYFISKLTVDALRPMFYIVYPKETIYENAEDVPNFTENAVPWFITFMALEMIFYWLKGMKNSISINDAITSMGAGMLQTTVKATCDVTLYHYVWSNFRLITVPWDSQVAWCICFLTQDFAYYLAHRGIHEISIFWASHQVHHSSEYYNLTTALRQSVVQAYATAGFYAFQALFIPTNIWMVHKHLNLIYQFWIHSEAVPKLGPLEWVLNTPSHHRVHHGRNPYCIDKNYGGTLIIWDRIFGTFEEERDTEPVIYGLVTNVNSFNPIYIQIFDFKVALWDKPMSVAGGWWNSLRAIVYPPGWFPPDSKVVFWLGWWRMEDTEDGIPEVEQSSVKYDPWLPVWVKWYTMVHFFVLTMAYFTFISERQNLEWVDFIAYIVFSVFNLQTFGALFDRTWYAALLELARCVSVYAYRYGYQKETIYHPIGFVTHLVWILSISLWTVIIVTSSSVHATETSKDDVGKQQ